MNEVVGWSTRARRWIVTAGRRVGSATSSSWDSFTDRGVGAIFMSLGVLVAAGIGVAVFEGRHGKDPVPCEQAQGHILTIERLSHGGRLTADEVAQLHDDASRLTAIAAEARGDDLKAITDAATVAGSTTVGQRLDVAKLTLEFDAACSQASPTGSFGRF